MGRWKQLDKNLYSCYACDSTDTYIDKHGARHWKINRDIEGNPINMLCMLCFNRYINNPKWNPIHNRRNNKRRFYFLGKVIFHETNPRIGICSECGRTNCKTDLHHDEYDPNNPLSHTRELCSSCHRKETIRLARLQKR